MIWFIFVLAIPTLFEAWLDRKGETPDGKRKDFWWAVLVGIFLLVFAKLHLKLSPIPVAMLLLAWRILVFDYLVSYLLIKNDVIVGNWYDYTGQTSKWDKIISKVNWKLRMAIRIILFGASLAWFLS